MGNRKNNSGQLSFDFTNDEELQRLRDQLTQLKAEMDHLRARNAMLIAENKELKDKYGEKSDGGLTPNDTLSEQETVTKKSNIEAKIKLFRQYFRGRDDVYAIRKERENGKSEYFPRRTYIGKEAGKHLWGENLPLTDAVIRDHLQKQSPPVTIGIYPLLQDETCWFLAIDFDKASWQEDARSFLETCQEFAIPASLERSRSGNGGHVWIFFAEPIPARTARKMGSELLTRTMEKRRHIGLDSYDRMFPNQDTLPKGKKLGNLIALPLQRIPGQDGNSLFVDHNLEPYKDQWIYLSSIRKMTRSEVEEIVREAKEYGETWNEPSTSREYEITGEMPTEINAVISDKLYIKKRGLSASLMTAFVRMGAFSNPEFYQKQRLRLYTGKTPRLINCTKELQDDLVLPRGVLDKVKALLENHNIPFKLQDERNSGSRIDVTFHGELRAKQKEAVEHLQQHDTGTLLATTAFGKTVLGIWMMAARKTNTLILVHRQQLLDQWRAQISLFLNLPLEEIGQIGAGKHKRTGKIDVAMLQTIQGKGKETVKEYISEYGHIIVDECHHVSAISFEKVLKQVQAKYVLGLTATLVRNDGLHPIVLMQCGPVRFRVNARSEAKLRSFEHVVIPRRTDFRVSDLTTKLRLHEWMDRLIVDEKRNDLIFDDLLKALDQGRSPILLTDRTSHLEYFEQRLEGFAKNVIVLRGGMGKKQRQEVQHKLQSIPDEEERVLLATGKFIGEGFDDSRLDTLFLVLPISGRGTVHQYAGRLHREHHSKREVQIHDYVDEHVPLLKKMYDKRCKGYSSLGYTISDPR